MDQMDIDALKYEKMILVFLDILGFSNFIKSQESAAVPVVAKTLSYISTYQHQIAEYCGSVRLISDSIVVLLPPDRRRSADFRNQPSTHLVALQVARHFQCGLLELGFLTRGSVVVGNIVDRAPLLFGPALIDAYQIESKIAKFPRVIIDQTFFDSATLEGTEYRRDYLGAENEEHLKAEIRNLMKTLIQDGDFTILHYLGAAHNEKPEDHAAYLKQADTYVAAITAIPPNDPSAVEKHEWLKAYFRRTTRALNFAS